MKSSKTSKKCSMIIMAICVSLSTLLLNACSDSQKDFYQKTKKEEAQQKTSPFNTLQEEKKSLQKATETLDKKVVEIEAARKKIVNKINNLIEKIYIVMEENAVYANVQDNEALYQGLLLVQYNKAYVNKLNEVLKKVKTAQKRSKFLVDKIDTDLTVATVVGKDSIEQFRAEISKRVEEGFLLAKDLNLSQLDVKPTISLQKIWQDIHTQKVADLKNQKEQRAAQALAKAKQEAQKAQQERLRVIALEKMKQVQLEHELKLSAAKKEQLTSLQNKISVAEKELSKLQLKSSTEESMQKEKLEHVQSLIAEKEDQLIELQNEISVADKKLAELQLKDSIEESAQKEKLEHVQSLIAEKEDQLTELQNEISVADKKLTELQLKSSAEKSTSKHPVVFNKGISELNPETYIVTVNYNQSIGKMLITGPYNIISFPKLSNYLATHNEVKEVEITIIDVANIAKYKKVDSQVLIDNMHQKGYRPATCREFLTLATQYPRKLLNRITTLGTTIESYNIVFMDLPHNLTSIRRHLGITTYHKLIGNKYAFVRETKNPKITDVKTIVKAGEEFQSRWFGTLTENLYCGKSLPRDSSDSYPFTYFYKISQKLSKFEVAILAPIDDRMIYVDCNHGLSTRAAAKLWLNKKKSQSGKGVIYSPI